MTSPYAEGATMSSSTESALLRGARSEQVEGVRMPDLGTGSWSRRSPGVDTSGEHAAARAQGYAVGWAEGRREAEASLRSERAREAEARQVAEAARAAEHAAAVTALHEAATLLVKAASEVCRTVDEQASELALALTRELVGRAPAEEGHVLARVTGLLPDHPVVRVRLHPDVAASAGVLTEQGVAVVADPTLERSDALVETDDHVLDLRVSEALARLARALR